MDKNVAFFADGHDQPASASAALTSGYKCRLNGEIGRGLKIGDIMHDQGIVSSHFEGKDLFRMSCELPMEGLSHFSAAGEEQAGYARVSRQGGSGFSTALNHVEHAIWVGPHPAIVQSFAEQPKALVR